MAQARRKAPAKAKRNRSGGGWAGIGMLLAGMAIGSLSTVLWHGAQTAEDGIGAGIRRMFEDSRQAAAVADKQPAERRNAEAQPERPSTDYTFYQVLPEIEVVAPSAEESTAAASQPQPESKPQTKTAAATAAEKSANAYMLQAGSYQRHADAERLKATLALKGLASAIQKVSIQGRGDFYRVRLGPYPTYADMVKADEQLSRAGIKALRLKMFKSG